MFVLFFIVCIFVFCLLIVRSNVGRGSDIGLQKMIHLTENIVCTRKSCIFTYRKVIRYRTPPDITLDDQKNKNARASENQ